MSSLASRAVVIGCALLASSMGDAPKPMTLSARLLQFHHGPGPCLRYAGAPPPPVEALQAAAGALLEAGVDSERLLAVLPVFVEKADAAEKPAHAAPRKEELRQALQETMSPKEKAVLAGAPEKFEQILDMGSATPKLDYAAAHAAFDAMSPSARSALMELWKTHPDFLQVRRISDLSRAMETVESIGRLKKAGQFVLDAYSKTGRWPEVLPPELSSFDGMSVHSFPQKDRTVISSTDVPADAWVEVTKDGMRPYQRPPCRNAERGSLTREEFESWRKGSGPGTRIVPVFDQSGGMSGGVAKGFKVFAFEPGCLLEKIGLCEGDLVKGAGPYFFTSPEQVFKAYEGLKNDRKVTLAVERAGKPMRLELDVTDQAPAPAPRK